MGACRATRLPTPTTARGAATRARIVEAAAELVAARGVTGTTLEDVLDASRTGKSQFYSHFANKDALMLAVVNAQSERFLGFQAFRLSEVNSLESLRQWRDQIVTLFQASRGTGGCLIGCLASALADRSEETRELLTESFQRWESHLLAALRSMQVHGILSASADPRGLSMAVACALQGGLLLAQMIRSIQPLEIALDMALDHISAHSVHAESI